MPRQERDPLEELHEIRKQLVADAGGTLDQLFELLKRRESQETREVVSFPPKPPEDSQGEVA